MRENPKPYEIYEDVKGEKYQIITVAEHRESGEEMVVYQALYGTYKIYALSLALFLSKVKDTKCPKHEGKREPMKAEALTQRPEERNISAQSEDGNIEEEPKEEAIDSMVLDFLDADAYEERLNILAALRHRITDDMINTMAIAVGVEVPEGMVEKRYEELRYCITMLQKYESGRRE